MNEHYTAVLQIEKVTVTAQKDGQGSYAKVVSTEREVTEIGKVVIRAATLAGLRARIAQHAELIEEN